MAHRKTHCNALHVIYPGKATENTGRTVPEAVQLKLMGATTISVAVGGDHDVSTYTGVPVGARDTRTGVGVKNACAVQTVNLFLCERASFSLFGENKQCGGV